MRLPLPLSSLALAIVLSFATSTSAENATLSLGGCRFDVTAGDSHVRTSCEIDQVARLQALVEGLQAQVEALTNTVSELTANATSSGGIQLPDGLNETELSHLDGVTGPVQSQIDALRTSSLQAITTRVQSSTFGSSGMGTVFQLRAPTCQGAGICYLMGGENTINRQTKIMLVCAAPCCATAPEHVVHAVVSDKLQSADVPSYRAHCTQVRYHCGRGTQWDWTQIGGDLNRGNSYARYSWSLGGTGNPVSITASPSGTPYGGSGQVDCSLMKWF